MPALAAWTEQLSRFVSDTAPPERDGNAED